MSQDFVDVPQLFRRFLGHRVKLGIAMHPDLIEEVVGDIEKVTDDGVVVVRTEAAPETLTVVAPLLAKEFVIADEAAFLVFSG